MGEPTVSQQAPSMKGVERVGGDPVLARIHEAETNIPSSTHGVFDLPCGYLDPQGVLHTEVHVREMTGHEEDMLMSKAVPNHRKIAMLVSSCTLRVGTYTDRGMINAIVNKMLVGDRVFLMFAVRRVSLGDEYPYRDTCPSCQTKGIFRLNLADLEIKKMIDPKKRQYSVTCPSGKVVVFHPLTGEFDEQIAKAGSSGAAISLAMLMRIETIQDQPPTLSLVQGLSHKDRAFLREAFDEVEGGVDTTLQMQCPQCLHEFEHELEVGQTGFFFPSQVLKDLKKKSL